MFARREGCPALREGGRQSDQAVRTEHSGPRAQRIPRRGAPRAEAGVPALLQVRAESLAGARARRRRAASVSGDWRVPRLLRPQRPRIGRLMPVRIGVVGAGALGFHPTRILRDVPGAVLVGFHDSNPERAATVSLELGVTAFPTLY